ncbi:MAG: hypothetical protein ACFFAU_01395 [Candidatus Hodarchaeota archaeon]
MLNKDYYTWRVIYKDGQIYSRGYIKILNLKPPFKFELIPLEKGLEKRSIDIAENQQLVYFKRVFGKLFVSSGKNEVVKILYCLGYKENDYTSVIWINPKTNKTKIQIGHKIKL